MSDASLIRLMSWLSPVFPTGGFSYSAGLESAVANELVASEAELESWLFSQLEHGSIRNESILLSQAWQGCKDLPSLNDLSGLAKALVESSERLDETMGQGKSFFEAASHWPDLDLPDRTFALPIAIGCATGRAEIPLLSTLEAWLNGFLINQLQASIRLSVTGQKGSAKILSKLEAIVFGQASKISTSSLDDLGSANFHAAIMSLQHEVLEPRLFRS